MTRTEADLVSNVWQFKFSIFNQILVVSFYLRIKWKLTQCEVINKRSLESASLNSIRLLATVEQH